MTPFRLWPHRGTIALLLALAACGPKATALYHDPSFTPAAIEEGNLVVLGAVAVPTIANSEFLSGGFGARLLDKHARDRRPDLPLLAMTDATQTVDLSTITDALEHYRTRGSLRPTELEALKPVSSVARYGILSRIDTNNVETKRDDLSEIDDGAVRSVIEIDAIRQVAATFDVYDLQTGSLVWTAYLAVKRDRTKRVERGERELDDPDALTGVGWTSGGEDPPDAPELSSLLGDLFRNFAHQLPKP